jgi:peptidyl-prolyl cis-trans isomerase C
MARKFLVLLLAFFLSGCGFFDRSGKEAVVTVGRTNITPDELKRDIKFMILEMGIEQEKVADVLNPLVDRIIDHYLILEYGRDKGITIPSSELESAIREIQKDYPDKVFQEMLLHRYVDFEEWKEGLRQQLLVKKIIHEASQNMTPVTFEEIRDYYEAHQNEFVRPQMIKFRQIVTRTREECEEVLKRIKDGERIEDLAAKYSIAPEAENGGVVDWVAKGVLEESMEKVLFSLPVGKTSDVVKTPYGYHIFEVLSKRSEGLESLPDAMEEIEAKLLQQKRENFYEGWLKHLKELYHVNVNKELLKTLEFG